MDLPYRAEYAKSGRASCKGCKSPIGQGTVRLAVMVQSPFFDGKQPQWYHFKCFFIKQRVKTVDDIAHFESLRIEDQDEIKKHVDQSSAIIVPEKKGKKRAADKGEKAARNAALKDFIVEYSKSSRATCRGCEQKIMKEEIRISKKDFETDIGKKYGGQDMWHHVTCFAQVRSELGYFESADKLPGFKSLSKDDQTQIKKDIPAIKQEDIPEIKKVKTEKEDDDDPKEKEYRQQNKIMFKYRDELKQNLTKNQMSELLEFNKQAIPIGEENILDRLSDVMTFGVLKPCKECKDGQLVFNKFGYICTGNATEWTKCNALTKEPERFPFTVPKEFSEEFSFLKKYKYVPRTRVFRDVNPTVPIKKEVKDEVDGKPRVQRTLPALYNMEFVILGKPAKAKDALKKQIVRLGGKVVTKIQKNVMAVVADKDMVEKMGARIREAETEQVHVVSEDFFDEAQANSGKIPDLIIKKSICNWGSDPHTRLPPEPSSSTKSKSGSIYTSKMPSKLTMKVKGGGAVDPDSGIEDIAHVHHEGKEKFTAILGITDIQSNKNSYYKIQLLKSDVGQRYWVFRAWGRIGTTVGGNKLEEMSTLHEAKKQFCNLYEEKSGNLWDNRHNFVKVPGRMYPIDVDYGEENAQSMAIVESESKLAKPVQDLIRMIFDVNEMKKVMMEFELDMEKMPLGKLSKKQIQNAFGVLSELQDLINKGGSDSKFIDASNRFYTLIPHSFGVDEVPILKEEDAIKQKLEMLDNLMELEIAYNLMKHSGSDHTLDGYYSQLNAEIDVLDKKSEEYKIMEEYLKNTHAATHSSYKLQIEEIYVVKRQGEEKRFKPFKKLDNHKLLWHGSRVTNFAGILSQGLRIAPPEAPVTGYMFGKGIYFADMVSKSANYCCTNPSNPNALILLCDVALGKMYEKEHSEYVTKLPKGFHSTKGVGRTQPDPNVIKHIDGIEVPMGKGVSIPGTERSSLLYNEYIVYDVAQVNVKYLLKLNFKFKY